MGKKLLKYFTFTIIFYFLLANFPNTKNRTKKVTNLLKNLNSSKHQKSINLSGILNYKNFFKKKDLKDISDDDLVVGYTDPDEILNLNGRQIIYGDIIIINNGKLNFQDADIYLYGQIFVLQNGILNIKNSTLNVLSKFIYSNSLNIFNNGKVYFDESVINTNGFSWIIGISSNGYINILDSNFIFPVTTSLSENSKAYVENSNPLEWVIFDSGYLELKNSKGPFMLWPVFSEGSNIDLSFPDGDDVSYFEISKNIPGISGINSTLIVENCKNVLWGMLVGRGANITVRNSNLKATGILANSGNIWDLTGICNNQHFNEYTLPINETNIRLINTYVSVFNLYLSGANEMDVKSSVVGEIGLTKGNKLSVNNTLIDGSGGYFFINGDSENIFLNSSLFSHLITNQNSTNLFYNSSILGGDIVANGNSVILLGNTIHDKIPKAYDNAFIIEGFINIPTSGEINSLIPIMGTACIYKGENSIVEFKNYSLSYKEIGDSEDWIPICKESEIITKNNNVNLNRLWIPICKAHKNPVYNGLLGVLNTSGFDEGFYNIRLTINLNVGEPINIERTIYLGIGNKSNDNIGNKVLDFFKNK